MPKIEERVTITDSLDLQRHFESILPALSLTETEDSWQKIEKSLMKLEVITKSGGYKHENFPLLFKSVAESITNSLLSERTKLSGTAADLLNSVAPRLGDRFESLIQSFIPTLLLICARTNKVALVRAKKCLLLIARHCKLPSLFPYLREGSKDKSQTVRIVSVEVTLMLLDSIQSKEKIARRASDVEVIIKGTATDRDPEVRQLCKRLFEVYVERWPERITLFTSTFTPTTRRYLALPKSHPTVQSKSTHLRPQASPVKRTTPSEPALLRSAGLSNQATPGHSILKVSQPSTSHTSSSHSNAPRAQVRVNSNPSSSSSCQSAKASEAESSSSQRESPEEQRRAALRAEILKQATGTPSQSIAARLALEQLDFQLKKAEKQRKTLESQEQHQQFKSTVAISRETDRALFNIAIAKKQSPRKAPGKAPGRIIVAAPPTSQRSALSDSTSRPAQRIASSTKEKAVTKSKVEEEDVFKSRPIEKVVPTKVTSSISKSLGARGTLLGPSQNTVDRAKARNSRGAAHINRKAVATLKVDIGKENIPPNSALSEIAEAPRDQLIVSASASQPVMTEANTLKENEPVALEQQEEIVDLKKEIAAEQIEQTEEPRVQQEIASDSIVEVNGADTDPCVLDIEKSASSPVVEEDSVLEAPDVLKESIFVNEEANNQQESTNVIDPCPLQDWTKMAASLQEDVPLSASSDSTYHKTIGPFMSTPLRRPLGSLQYNAVTSASSPLATLSHHSKLNSTKPSTFQSPSQIIRNSSSLLSKAKTRVLLVASRKM